MERRRPRSRGQVFGARSRGTFAVTVANRACGVKNNRRGPQSACSEARYPQAGVAADKQCSDRGD